MSKTGCVIFDKWCELNDATPLPALPQIVAKFVADISAMGVEKIWPMVGEISRAHYLVGLADPTLGGAVSTAINDIARIEPPRSWPDAFKLRFAALPYDIQALLAVQDKDWRRAIGKAHSEAAEARKAAAAIQQSAKETEHGIESQHAAA